MTAPKKDDKADEKAPAPDTVKVAKPDDTKTAEPEERDTGSEAGICVDCFGGVWPTGQRAASCEHGTWSRDDSEALDEAEKAAEVRQAAQEAERARQGITNT